MAHCSHFISVALCLGLSAAAHAIDTTGWTCSGTLDQQCGTRTADDGVVPLSPVPGSTGYAWVSTYDSAAIAASQLPSGIADTSEVTNGSTYRSAPFSANANAEMRFHFNYVTSDGSSDYSDFAWARLLDSAGNQVALLFTARTTDSGSTIPGSSMPTPAAKLTPTSVPIIAGAPAWSPLRSDSGECYQTGCGYTGWVQASYTIPSSGTYQLEIGVVNWSDMGYASGLAVDGLTVGGQVVAPATVAKVPTLGEWGLMGLGLGLALLGGRRRLKA